MIMDLCTLRKIDCTDTNDKAFETGKLILETLKERTDVSVYQYTSGTLNAIDFIGSVTDYFYDPEKDGDIGTLLTDYVRENALDYTVVVGKSSDASDADMECELVPGESVTREEQWALADEISEKFHIGAWIGMPYDSGKSYGGTTVEMAANVDGDANNDGELDIADATLVLQSIGNGDKYSLSIQGEYNADVDGSGGVTALDALEIQKMDAGLR